MKYTLPLLLLISQMVSAQETKYRPINALYPEKIFSKTSFATLEFSTTLPLVKRVISDFELGESAKIAILYNGNYKMCMLGNGQFLNYEKKPLLEKIPFDSISRIEAKFDPVLKIKNYGYEFTGSVNLFVPNSLVFNHKDSIEQEPEPWLDPMTDRLLTLKEEQKPRRRTDVLATPHIHAGLFVGLMPIRGSVYVGVPIEVPFNNKLSLQGEISGSILSNNLDIVTPGGSTLSRYTMLTLENSIQLKYYLNPRYFRIYLTAGPFVELAKNSWGFEILSPTPDLIYRERSTWGMTSGIGMQFYGGLYLHIGASKSFIKSEKLLLLQGKRGVSLTVGFRFGKP
jgi:hypothetical protein